MCLCFFDGGGFKATSRWAVVNLSGAVCLHAPEGNYSVILYWKLFRSILYGMNTKAIEQNGSALTEILNILSAKITMITILLSH